MILSLSPVFSMHLLTHSALTMPCVCGVLIPVSVFWREFVAVSAVRSLSALARSLSQVLCRKSTNHIDTSRYRFQVGWINAASHTAEVIQIQPLWDGTDQQLICSAMGTCHGGLAVFPVYVDSGVTSSVAMSQPQPATTVRFGRNIAHEPIQDRFTLVDIMASRHLRKSSFRFCLEPLGAPTPCGSFNYSAEASA